MNQVNPNPAIPSWNEVMFVIRTSGNGVFSLSQQKKWEVF